jgi:Peptidase A4 family
VSCVEGSWVQPSIDCSSGTQLVAIWVGIDGVNGITIDSAGTLEQIGTVATCVPGGARMNAWMEVLPAEAFSVELPGVPVRTGDDFWARVLFNGDTFDMWLVNVTQAKMSRVHPPGAGAARATAEWIVEAPSHCSARCKIDLLANFGTVQITGAVAAIGGVTSGIDDDSWLRGQEVIQRGGITRATVSPVADDGRAFTVTWRHQ